MTADWRTWPPSIANAAFYSKEGYDRVASLKSLEQQVLDYETNARTLRYLRKDASFEEHARGSFHRFGFTEPTRNAPVPQTNDAYVSRWLELYLRQTYFEHPHECKTALEPLVQAVIEEIRPFLPSSAEQADGSSTFVRVPLLSLVQEPLQLLDRLWRRLTSLPPDDHQYRAMFYHYYIHWRHRPDVDKTQPPSKHGGSLAETIRAYFSDTPFERVLQYEVAIRLSTRDRFSHTHIVSGSGHGKTTLMHSMVRRDLASDEDPSLVIIDPHSDLVQRILHDNSTGLGEYVLYINPRDMDHPPAVNVFAPNQERLASYDPATREQVVAGVIQTFDYFFKGLLGADLTAKQGILFRYFARLLITLPETMGRNATVLDMLRLTTDTAEYQPAIDRLPYIQRDFFERDFKGRAFNETKEQIRYRLLGVLENPIIAQFFSSPENKIDLFHELNNGAVILIDAAQDFLKSGTDIFGRMWISLVLQAVLERATIAPANRRPTFLYIDEAATFFDDNIDNLLTDTRKFNCGCIFAHQYLDQADQQLRASLAANTAIKFAGGLSFPDARMMASEMRTTPEFLTAQPPLQFAAYIRGKTPTAVSFPVERIRPEAPSDKLEKHLAANRARVSGSSPTYAFEPQQPIPQAAEPEADDEW